VVDLRLHSPYLPGMNRRRFLLTSLAGALAGPVAGQAQPTGKAYRLGILSPVPGQSRPVMAGVEAGLRELGYVEGRNIAIEWSLGDRLPERATELVGHRPDVIIASPYRRPLQSCRRPVRHRSWC
jgi:putative ABC transport system substrate-binding protein